MITGKTTLQAIPTTVGTGKADAELPLTDGGSAKSTRCSSSSGRPPSCAICSPHSRLTIDAGRFPQGTSQQRWPGLSDPGNAEARAGQRVKAALDPGVVPVA